MEPRPPQPRSSHPFEPPGSPETAGIGERLYPTPGEPAYYPGAEAYLPGAAAEPPLLPRRQRRQRGALRGIAVAVVAIGALLALGWYFRDAVRGFVDPPAPTPTVAAQAAAPGTPTPAAETAGLPNALATVTPTPASEVSATATPAPGGEANVAQETSADGEAAAEPDRDISSETLPLLDLLPTQAQMPPGLILADEAERSQAEVVASLGGTEEASQLLDEWGWSGNAFRDFIADPEAPPPTGTTFLNASVHRFADDASANNAMVVFSDYVIFTQGLQNVDAPAIGDDAVLLVGSPDGIPLAVLYAQEGPILYRVGGSSGSAEADPTSDVLTVAGGIIFWAGAGRLIVLNRENAIGLILLLLCAVVALVLLYSIATGARFQYTGPSWLGIALAILFIGASLYGFVSRPGRRWPWQRNEPPDRDGPDR